MDVIHPPATDSTRVAVLAEAYVACGTPTPPPQPALGEPIDLNQLLVRHPGETFFIRVAGDSMTGAGIVPGDLLVVDRARPARRGDIVVALVDQQFTVKRYDRGPGGEPVLWPENPVYGPIFAGPGRPVELWGVVTACVHRFVA